MKTKEDFMKIESKEEYNKVRTELIGLKVDKEMFEHWKKLFADTEYSLDEVDPISCSSKEE